MRTPLPIRVAALVSMLVVCSALPAQETRYSAFHDYRVVTVADGLVRPWSLAFLPDGDLLITEKPGRLRIVRDGQLLEEPVAGLPPVYTEGQAGLLDVAPHPDFARNRLLYLSYSKPLDGGESTTAVIRGRFENGRLNDVEELFEAQSRGRGHYGSRLAFDGQGHLFITVGDRQAPPQGDLESHPAQDLSNHHGVTLRLNEDGSVPGDNPFVDQDGALPEIWSYGLRNAQGLLVDRASGRVWITEHGPQGGDELNLIEPGANYGWPVIGYGVNYRTGSAIHAAPTATAWRSRRKSGYPLSACPGWRSTTATPFRTGAATCWPAGFRASASRCSNSQATRWSGRKRWCRASAACATCGSAPMASCTSPSTTATASPAPSCGWSRCRGVRWRAEDVGLTKNGVRKMGSESTLTPNLDPKFIRPAGNPPPGC
jgi:aldose sugar dehydrogenase